MSGPQTQAHNTFGGQDCSKTAPRTAPTTAPSSRLLLGLLLALGAVSEPESEFSICLTRYLTPKGPIGGLSGFKCVGLYRITIKRSTYDQICPINSVCRV